MYTLGSTIYMIGMFFGAIIIGNMADMYYKTAHSFAYLTNSTDCSIQCIDEQSRSEIIVRSEQRSHGRCHDSVGLCTESAHLLRPALHLRNDRRGPLPHHLRLGRRISR